MTQIRFYKENTPHVGYYADAEDALTIAALERDGFIRDEEQPVVEVEDKFEEELDEEKVDGEEAPEVEEEIEVDEPEEEEPEVEEKPKPRRKRRTAEK